MKKLSLILLLVFVARSSWAEVFEVPRGQTVKVKLANVVGSTGVITTGATFTLTCGCANFSEALTLGACNGSTAAAEISSTGIYNITVNSANNTTKDECYIKMVAGTVAGSVDHLVILRNRKGQRSE